jgi:hypothetical protein
VISGSGLNIVRVFLFRIDNGDRRKFVAQANDTDSGGGPRDLRVRPEDKMWPFFERLLSGRERVNRPRNGGTVDILVGEILWKEMNGASEERATIEIWPFQPERPNECRIVKVNQWDAAHLIQTDPTGGQSVLMIFQQIDGDVRLFFTTETFLRTGKWDKVVQKFAIEWLDRTKTGRRPKSAFLDLNTNERYTGD